MPGSIAKARKLRAAFIDRPDSTRIAADLNEADAHSCPHGRNVCHVFCGVKRDPPGHPRRYEVDRREDGTIEYDVLWIGAGPWVVIPHEERVAWCDRVEALAVRDRRRRWVQENNEDVEEEP